MDSPAQDPQLPPGEGQPRVQGALGTVPASPKTGPPPPFDVRSLSDQSWENRGDASLVRDTMVYDSRGQLLDKAPYPAVYERAHQQRCEMEHPERMRAMHQLAREQMVQAKMRMADKENQYRSGKTYEVGDSVRIKLDHVQLPVWTVSKCRKLRGKYFGPFTVAAVHSPIAVEVTLPKWLHANLHPVFHPMYLKMAEKRSADVNLRAQLRGVFDSADYGVESILAHRIGARLGM